MTLTFLGMPAYKYMEELEKSAFFVDRKKGIIIDRSKNGKPTILFLDIILLIRKKGNVNKRRV